MPRTWDAVDTSLTAFFKAPNRQPEIGSHISDVNKDWTAKDQDKDNDPTCKDKDLKLVLRNP